MLVYLFRCFYDYSCRCVSVKHLWSVMQIMSLMRDDPHPTDYAGIWCITGFWHVMFVLANHKSNEPDLRNFRLASGGMKSFQSWNAQEEDEPWVFSSSFSSFKMKLSLMPILLLCLDFFDVTVNHGFTQISIALPSDVSMPLNFIKQTVTANNVIADAFENKDVWQHIKVVHLI